MLTSKEKHTVGPWRVDLESGIFNNDWARDRAKNQAIVVRSIPGFAGQCPDTSIALINSNFADESEANAKLIASAPELLEAAERAALDFRQFRPDTNGTLTQLEAAIAKATQ